MGCIIPLLDMMTPNLIMENMVCSGSSIFRSIIRGYYTALLLRGKLTEHLNQIDDATNARVDFLVPQMQKQLHVDETLKAYDQMAWVREMINIYNAAEEIVLNEIISS